MGIPGNVSYSKRIVVWQNRNGSYATHTSSTTDIWAARDCTNCDDYKNNKPPFGVMGKGKYVPFFVNYVREDTGTSQGDIDKLATQILEHDLEEEPEEVAKILDDMTSARYPDMLEEYVPVEIEFDGGIVLKLYNPGILIETIIAKSQKYMTPGMDIYHLILHYDQLIGDHYSSEVIYYWMRRYMIRCRSEDLLDKLEGNDDQ